MTEWNERHLEALVRKMGLKRAPGQGGTPIHLSLHDSSYDSEPLLTKIMRLDAGKWVALDYDETDRISVARYLGSLGCRTDRALSHAARYQQPLTLELARLLIDAGARDRKALSRAAINQRPLVLELAKLLIDAGARDREALSYAAINQRPLIPELAKLLIDAGAFNKSVLRSVAMFQHPLPFELAKLLMDVGCDLTAQDGNGGDAFVLLARSRYPVAPQVTDLFLSTGCRTVLDGCKGVFYETHLRFDQILKRHAEWKETQTRLLTENSPADSAMDWSR